MKIVSLTALAVLFCGVMFGQAVKPTASKAGVPKTAVPKTPDGHPDLQGIWTNATLTPLQRPKQFTGQLVLTEDEAKAFVKEQNKELADSDGASDSPIIAAAGSSGTGGYNVLFIDRGSTLARVDGQPRSSLIVDPPDGRLPARVRVPRPGVAPMSFNTADVKARPLSERCLVGFGSTSGPPMLPVLYNNNYQIVQTPGAILILVEMIHDARIIRMNGTHPPPDVKQWLGDSIGHWEGDTLVVDTTNIDPRNTFYNATGEEHVIERFRRIDADTILYRATVDDPSFAKPWTVEFPFNAAPGPIYEYACHEGNYAERDILGGAAKAAAGK